MAAPRAPFVYPRLFRISLRNIASTVEATPTSRQIHRVPFSSTARRRTPPQTVTQRYGTANEPPAHLVGRGTLPPNLPKENEQKKLPEPEEADKEAQPDTPDRTRQQVFTSGPTQKSTQPKDGDGPLKDNSSVPSPPTESNAAVSPAQAQTTSTLNNVLEMQPPMSTPSESAPPHLQTPPHVHHFDTYSLVRDLTSSGAFTNAQAVIIMKALRVILADNVDLARAGIMSRSDAEMDAYQFRAASSELRTETRQRRDAQSDRLRADRTQLQHEVDILSQRIAQESLTLKDELKGMFDDRKMNVRMERRGLDNRIQELGYKITVAMNSGMRNEIEGLRFLVTRNAAITLAAFIVGSLLVLWMASRRKAKDERVEREKKERERVERRMRENGRGRGTEPTDAQEELSRRVQQGDNPALVSLG